MSNFSFGSLYKYSTGAGIVIPDTSDLKHNVENMMYAIFGADLDVTPETPMGRLIEAMTMLMVDTLGVNAQNANQYNIYQATGSYLDGIGALFGVTRKAATHTRVKIQVEGTCETVPAGSVIETTAGDAFAVDEDITLQNEVGIGYASAIESGPVPCDYGTLTKISTAVLGWNTVNNNTQTSPVYGTNLETDAAYRDRIIEARATGSASVQGIANAIYAADKEVSSCVVYENGYGQPIVKNGVTMKPHSIYVCASGGNDEKIANAVFKTKTAGAGYTTANPGTGVTRKDIVVVDEISGVSYHVYFFRPVEIIFKFTVTARKSSYMGLDMIDDIRKALVTYVNEVGIGKSISPEGAAAFIASALPSLKVDDIKMTDVANNPLSSYNLAGYQVGRTGDSYILVNEI